MIEIRSERPEDYEQIHDLIIKVFTEAYGSGDVEAKLVEDFRTSTDYQACFSKVATDNGIIIGHILLSVVQIDTGSKKLPAGVLAPLGVEVRYQKQGIGAKLMHAIIEEARVARFPALFLQGSPHYYPRFGFVPASSLGFISPFTDVPDQDNMALMLTSTHTNEIKGKIVYPEIWDPLM